MWDFRNKLRTLVSGMLAKRQPVPCESPGRAVDWLPPVLGPEEWSIGRMAGRSAKWHLDRGRA
jgi:hypothetical protein